MVPVLKRMGMRMRRSVWSIVSYYPSICIVNHSLVQIEREFLRLPRILVVERMDMSDDFLKSSPNCHTRRGSFPIRSRTAPKYFTAFHQHPGEVFVQESLFEEYPGVVESILQGMVRLVLMVLLNSWAEGNLQS
eukprot:TRINITY_DN4774_c0_g2_i4.p1 TRINITY_DN4774_c0_g2~~TRINITY_DN4774_c0_g2_i4.p1  ORF type:complete len:134 (+),score=12.85 TRINITY_DN4774_c0_g2_i4:274-675(+)